MPRERGEQVQGVVSARVREGAEVSLAVSGRRPGLAR